MAVAPIVPIYKNSGILRYKFTNDPTVPQSPQKFAGALVVGAPAVIVTCMGGDLVVPDQPDQDNQLFGSTSGHGVIAGASGYPAMLAIGAANFYRSGMTVGRIPSGSKVTAIFQPQGAPAFPPGGVVAVNTRIIESQIRDAAGVVLDAAGTAFLSLIQVELYAVGAPAAVVPGTLIVRVEHSIIDIPGFPGQDQNGSTQNAPA
jgi:hypothetical protein